MCGISGVFNYLDKSINSRDIINKIINIQQHRGPDGNGIWESNCRRVTLGHNRLSIIDLSEKANQPFISNDKNYILTFNGEIYNFKEIKSELVQKKIKFKSNSDTEVVLEAYKYWKLEFLQKIRGMFSLAIWDNKKKKLILARDPFGIKPLYYSNLNGVFYFASQIKSLLSINDINSKKSNAGIVSYYLLGHIQDPFTLYNDIKSLEKGNCVVIDQFGYFNKFEFASIKNEIVNSKELKFKKKDDAIESLKEILEETVYYHEIADVSVDYCLSSGIDSSTILASIKNKKNSKAITIDLDDDIYFTNEKLLAKKTAFMNHIPHNTVKININELEKIFEFFYKKMDSPTNDGLNNFLISYYAKKQNTKVMITGVGGDEFFFGYPSFSRIPLINNFAKLFPKNRVFDFFFNSALSNYLEKKKLNTKYSSIYSYGNNLNNAFLLQRSLFMPNEIKNLINEDEFKLGWQELNILENINQDTKDIKNKNLSIMYLEIKYYLCSKLLRDIDWTSMSNSIEMRTPLVDWFFFKKLLPILKSNVNLSKKSLLDTVKNKIPTDLYKRKKTGFGIPHKSYLNKVLGIQTKYSNALKDWSIYSYNKFLNNNK